jgi:hypothetical protein
MKVVAITLILLYIFHSDEAQNRIDTSLLARELKEFNKVLLYTIDHKDSLSLEKLVSKNFVRIHETNGAVEGRSSWLNGLLKK